MSLPWQYGPRRCNVPAAEASLIQLNVPMRGTLRALKIYSPDGVSGTFEIFTNEEAARLNLAIETGSSSGSLENGIAPFGYQLLDGSLTDGEYETRELDIPYINADGAGPTSREGRLWMVFTPAGGVGTIEYVIAMTIETPDF